jgi:hypothetical protein
MRTKLRRWPLMALAAGAAWWAGYAALLTPAQAILLDPALQSAKFLAVVVDLPPPARATGAEWMLPAAFLVIGALQALVFAFIAPALPRARVKRGLAFAAIAWALCFPWFEFYLPWNVMREPGALVALELALWAGVMIVVGLAISFTAGPLDPDGAAGGG